LDDDNGLGLDAALEDFFSSAEFAKSIRGAESSWRGFELQTLYICSRLLDDKSGDYVFWPETVEDLLIVEKNTESPKIELVQIKAKGSPLKLSDVASPGKDGPEGKADQLLGHLAFLLGRGIHAQVTVVVFGELGTELRGFSEGRIGDRKSVFRKIQAMYGDEIADYCAANLRFEAKAPAELRSRVERSIASVLEVSAIPRWFANTLTAEVRSRSMSRTKIDLTDVNGIARGMAVGAAAQSSLISQYGKSLFPLSQRYNAPSTDSAFADEYRLGTNAQPEHIAANCDAPRPRWLDAIDSAFSDHDLVIVQGASGQGKSTICLRYLYDRVPIYNSYMVEGSLDSNSANEVAASLVALAESSREILYVYIDGATDRHWLSMAQSLRRKATGKVRILVSIRDDDMNRLPFSEKDLPHAVVRPVLCREEAELIFSDYENPASPSFAESWRSFGSSGPLMEYTASLGTGSTLRSMLRAQIEGLIAEGRDDAWLYALLLASMLGAEGVSVSQRDLSEASGCTSMATFVERVKNEHLLRVGDDGTIGPLHPYRSKLIATILKEKLLLDESRVAVDVVKCATRNLGTVLVRLAAEASLSSPFDCGKLAHQAGASWVKPSETLKYTLWRDTRRLFLQTESLRAKLGEAHLQPSLAFMLSGGVADEHASLDAEVLLDLIDEHVNPYARELIDEAGKCKVDYADTVAALEAIEIDSLKDPDSAEEAEAAGFVLTQYAARGLVGEGIARLVGGLGDRFDPESYPLEESLDYAMGLQLCGCSLALEYVERLEARIAEEHTVVWHVYDGSKVNVLQVPFGNVGDFNGYLVAALVAYRRLYPHAQEYCGKQLGVDEWVPEEYAKSFEKHIPAENLPFYFGTIANRMFLSMCEYEEAMPSWSCLANAITEGSHQLQRMCKAYLKAVDRLFEKGSISKLGTEIDDIGKALADGLSGVKVGIPKDALDPQSFTALVSPVDASNYREADAASVYTNGPSRDRFRKTRSLISFMQTFSETYPAGLRMLMGGQGSHEREQQVRAQIVSLADVAKHIGLAEEEQRAVFGQSLLPADMEEDLVVLCCALNACLSKPLRNEHGVGYSQRMRARKIMRCRSDFSAQMAFIEGVEEVRGEDGRLAFAIDLGVIGEGPSFEDIAAAALHAMYGDLGGPDRIAESMLLDSYLGDITLDILVNGCFFGSAELRASQLMRYAGDGKVSPFGPVPALPTRVRAYRRSETVDLYAAILDLQKVARVCLSVNRGIAQEDPDFCNVTNSYSEWQSMFAEESGEAVEMVRPLLSSWISSLPVEDAGIEEEFEATVRRMPKAIDSTVVDYLGCLAELVSTWASLPEAFDPPGSGRDELLR